MIESSTPTTDRLMTIGGSEQISRAAALAYVLVPSIEKVLRAVSR